MKIELTRSQLAESLMFLEGKQYSLDDYPFGREIYDSGAIRKLLMCGRQVSKTITIAGHHVTDSTQPHFRNLYIAPLRDQASYYSKSKLGQIIEHSPRFKKRWVDKRLANGVWYREFRKGSEIILRYADDDPDRVRGISSDRNCFDEIQDIVYDNVVPVVNETLGRSKRGGYELYCGTPKSTENPIQALWEQSSQREWVMKCTGCKKYNYVDSERSVGKRGIICVKCGKYLQPRNGFWHPMNPWKGDPEDPLALLHLQGYHVSQLILPETSEDVMMWAKLLRKLSDPLYSEMKISNEIFGRSTALGARFLNREDLVAGCRPYAMTKMVPAEMFSDIVRDVTGQMEIYGGIDWSGGGANNKSRTVVYIWGILPDERKKTMYFKLFPGKEPTEDIAEIISILKLFNVKMIGADAGVGALANSLLRQTFGRANVIQFQYGSFRKHFLRGADRIMVDRTSVIDSVMAELKQGRCVFPMEEQCELAFHDILALHTEILPSGKRIWTKRVDRTDDVFHAMVFGWLAAEVRRGRILLYGSEEEKQTMLS